MELIAMGGIVLVIWAAIEKMSKPKSPSRRAAVIVPGRTASLSAGAVFAWIIKVSALYAVFVGVFAAYLDTYPPFWVEWWFLTIGVDFVAFAIMASASCPKSVRAACKQNPDVSDSPLGRVTGLLLTAVGLVGMGIHVTTLAGAPGWKLFS